MMVRWLGDSQVKVRVDSSGQFSDKSLTLVDSKGDEYCNELTTMVKICILARIELIELIGITRLRGSWPRSANIL